MNRIHYFTDLDLLSSQNGDDKFGPVSLSDVDYQAGEDRFRVSSHHSATNNPMAYAICNGQLLVQQDANNVNLVNIALKPSEQPKNGLPKIKYFIYRGVLKSSLSDGLNVLNGSNTLTKNILDHNAVTPQKVLGIELTGTNYSDTDPVDNAFYISKPDFELWNVYGGWSIGLFNMAGFGFQIVFDSPDYEITFEDLRADRNLIKVNTLSGSATQVQEFEHKTLKQDILNFLDPAAFWGSMYNNSILARLSTDSTSSELIHNFSKRKKDEIYRDLIEGGTVGSPIDIYLNKNTVFLDVRNDWNDSFNYFGSYNDGLKISFIDDIIEPTTTFDYYSSGWPVLALTAIPGGGNHTPVRIAFPTSIDSSPLVQVIYGDRKFSMKERIKDGKSSFKRLEDAVQSGYTDGSLFLEVPNHNSGLAVCNYIKLKYLDSRLYDESEISSSIPFKKQYPIDYVFRPTSIRQLLSTTDVIKMSIYDSHAYINNLERYGIDYSAKIGIAKDQGNTVLFWTLARRNKKNRFKASAPSYSITSSTENSESLFVSLMLNRALPDNFLEETAVINGNDVQLIEEFERSFSFFNKRNDLDYNSEFNAIVLSDSDFAAILNLANTNFINFHSPYLCISNLEKVSDDNSIPVMKIDFSLKGLADDGSGGIEILEVSTGITVYTTL